MDMLPSGSTDIVLQELDTDNVPDSQALSAGFLRAITRSLRYEHGDYPTPARSSSETILETNHQISSVCDRLVLIFRDLEKYRKFLSYRDEAAKDLLDLLQKLLDHASLEPRFRLILYVALVRLCRKSELYPRCFSLTDITVDSLYPLFRGGFGDIYKGQYNGRAVCVKAVQLYQQSNRSALEKVVLVSHPLISDVASGMKYLHDNGVVHGDLKSLNVLVTESRRACLADFGLSYVTESGGLGGPDLSSFHASGGTQGFEAPELARSDEFRRTSASDVFAFGMVCFEMFTGEFPFGNNRAAALSIIQGARPKRPTSHVHVQRGLTDTMWALMEWCWSHSPENRPSAAEILQALPPPQTSWQRESWGKYARTPTPGFRMDSDGQLDETIASALVHL
ncbi:hypothetical protein C0992_008014 [Termitomyces sp. T32_za158]|nr:hypothetical protein C0992_008014 [Termitomyces sp. T32_za158]